MPIRILASRYLIGNSVVAAVSLALLLVLDFVYVRSGQKLITLRSPALGGMIMALSLVGFVVATWSAVEGSRTVRAVITGLSSLITFSIWMAFALLLLYWFHFAVGGAE